MKLGTPTLAAAAACVATTALLVGPGDVVAASARLITGAQIKNNSVTGKDLRDGTVQGRDLAKNARVAPRGPQGPQGPQGPAGAPGPAGTQGPEGTAAAYGSFDSVGNLEPYAVSKNITDDDVRAVGDGQFCVKAGPRGWKHAIATGSTAVGAGVIVVPMIQISTKPDAPLAACDVAAGETIRIRTFAIDAATGTIKQTGANFHLWLED